MTRRPLPALPRAALLAALPVLLVQGTLVRRTTPRLADAEGVEGRVGAGVGPVRVVMLGDSVAAGVGLTHHEESLVGHLARGLADRSRRPVAWRVLAQTGATASVALGLVDREVLADADVVVVSIGVNDTKDLHSDRRWREDLGRLLDAVLETAPRADVLLVGIPPMEVFPALPSPLAELLGARSRRLDRIGAEVVASRPRVRRLELDLPDDLEAFASDGFHPSSAVHAHLARSAVGLLRP